MWLRGGDEVRVVGMGAYKVVGAKALPNFSHGWSHMLYDLVEIRNILLRDNTSITNEAKYYSL